MPCATIAVFVMLMILGVYTAQEIKIKKENSTDNVEADDSYMDADKKKTAEKLDALLAELWKRSRFASYFFQSVHFSPDSAVPTLALALFSSRMILFYSPDFIATIDTEELVGLLVHEMLHVVHGHDHRSSPGDDPYLQNLAQDMVINSYMNDRRARFFSRLETSTGEPFPLVLPPGLQKVPGDFFEETGIDDPLWEDLYRWLREKPEETLKSYRGGAEKPPGISLPGMSDPGLMNLRLENPLGLPDDTTARAAGLEGIQFYDSDMNPLPTGIHLMYDRGRAEALSSKRDQVIQFAARDAESREDRVYREIRGIIERVEKADLDSWRHLVKSIVDFSSQSSHWVYSYGRFNRRYFGNGIYAPGRIFREQELLTVAVDVSGSMVMRPEEIEAAFGVVEELLGKYRVHILCIDENLFVPVKSGDRFTPSRDISSPCVYNRGDWRYIRTGSSGTTFFAPLFNEYMLGHHEMLLVITDGYIYDLERLKKYSPTLWLVSAGRKEPFEPPFGRAVSIGSGPAGSRHG